MADNMTTVSNFTSWSARRAPGGPEAETAAGGQDLEAPVYTYGLDRESNGSGFSLDLHGHHPLEIMTFQGANSFAVHVRKYFQLRKAAELIESLAGSDQVSLEFERVRTNLGEARNALIANGLPAGRSDGTTVLDDWYETMDEEGVRLPGVDDRLTQTIDRRSPSDKIISVASKIVDYWVWRKSAQEVDQLVWQIGNEESDFSGGNPNIDALKQLYQQLVIWGDGDADRGIERLDEQFKNEKMFTFSLSRKIPQLIGMEAVDANFGHNLQEFLTNQGSEPYKFPESLSEIIEPYMQEGDAIAAVEVAEPEDLPFYTARSESDLVAQLGEFPPPRFVVRMNGEDREVDLVHIFGLKLLEKVILKKTGNGPFSEGAALEREVKLGLAAIGLTFDLSALEGIYDLLQKRYFTLVARETQKHTSAVESEAIFPLLSKTADLVRRNFGVLPSSFVQNAQETVSEWFLTQQEYEARLQVAPEAKAADQDTPVYIASSLKDLIDQMGFPPPRRFALRYVRGLKEFDMSELFSLILLSRALKDHQSGHGASTSLYLDYFNRRYEWLKSDLIDCLDTPFYFKDEPLLRLTDRMHQRFHRAYREMTGVTGQKLQIQQKNDMLKSMVERGYSEHQAELYIQRESARIARWFSEEDQLRDWLAAKLEQSQAREEAARLVAAERESVRETIARQQDVSFSYDQIPVKLGGLRDKARSMGWDCLSVVGAGKGRKSEILLFKSQVQPSERVLSSIGQSVRMCEGVGSVQTEVREIDEGWHIQIQIS